LLTAVLCAGGVLLLLPAAVLLVETLAAFLPGRRREKQEAALTPRVVVLVPAHNEAAQIAETVRALVGDLPTEGSVLVIADNCTDETALRARTAGATVVERQDLSLVGKGFAISRGLEHLAASPPDVVIIVDADCQVSAGGVALLAWRAARSGRPIQAEYLLGAPESQSPMAVVSALAVLLRNRIRPRGLDRLGLPCHLTGSGMAFPWSVLRAAPETGANLVEDLVMGIDLALLGHPAELCPEVTVQSSLPDSAAATLKQRRRWEHGQLHTLFTYVPRLLGAGIARRRASLVALGLDLLVPPLALLVMLQVAWLGATALAWTLKATSILPASLAFAGLVQVGLVVAAAWIGFGRKTIRLRQLVFIPLYLIGKVPLYVALILRGRQKKWERTTRKGESSERSPK
jgi:cellulose synthase/poly-beta-1,6-N-acetylglucosamine synthase-like glycosyltransferase